MYRQNRYGKIRDTNRKTILKMGRYNMPDEMVSERVGQVVVSQLQIEACVNRVARELEQFYQDKQDVLVIVLLAGAKSFADDLFAKLDSEKFKIEYVKASSYYNGTNSSGKVRIDRQIDSLAAGHDVLVIDDIYDTGLTLKKVRSRLAEAGAGDVRICVLLERETQRKEKIEIDFLGVKVPKGFLIGYGLDYEGQYRELPFIATLKE